jgi:hypothetical protein
MKHHPKISHWCVTWPFFCGSAMVQLMKILSLGQASELGDAAKEVVA